MIDTDKYKGHDEDWKIGHSGVSHFIHVGDFQIYAIDDMCEEEDMGEANAQLIADAPLLLAEVKRLRLLFRELINDMSADEYTEWCNRIGCPDGLEVEAMKNE